MMRYEYHRSSRSLVNGGGGAVGILTCFFLLGVWCDKVIDHYKSRVRKEYLEVRIESDFEDVPAVSMTDSTGVGVESITPHGIG